MRIGIIAEGGADQMVLRNIFRSFGIDGSDIIDIKPSLAKDENDENNPNERTIGTLQGVKKACLPYEGRRYYFERALNFQSVDYIVIHLDTAEIDSQDFAFIKPTKQTNPNYSTELRQKVIDLIDGWLENTYKNQLFYAVAIEEIEAWCLTIFKVKDSIQSADPKKRLQLILNKDKKYKNTDFDKITSDFRNTKKLKQAIEFNQSLHDFYESVKEKINPE